MKNEEPVDPDDWMRWRFGDPTAHAGTEDSITRLRYEFARDVAPLVAEGARLNLVLTPYRPSVSVSLRTVLFTDDNDTELIVVVGEQEPPREVDLALPYALEHVGDRDLVIVVPTNTEGALRARLPWIDHHTRLFTYDDNATTEHAIPLRSITKDEAQAEPATGSYELSPQHLGWGDEVIAWADGHPSLIASHRATYLGWKAEGRLVLKIDRAKGKRLRIAAGVRPGSDSPKATGTITILDGPLVDAEPIREAVRRAIAAQVSGEGAGNDEHRFQARLQTLDPSQRLGLVTFVPEFPASRPGPNGSVPAFIDFLGVDGNGRLHVVETKVGASESTVVFQALDYWVWVEANRTALASEFGADPELTAAVSIVVLPKADGAVLHRHNSHVIDRLSRSVPLRIWRAEPTLNGSIRLLNVHRYDAAASARWTDKMRRRVQASAAHDGIGAGTKVDPLAGVHSDAVETAEGLKNQGLLHPYFRLAHSSQRFAVDLFGSLDPSAVAAILTPYFGPIASADSPDLEWIDPHDSLNESTKNRPSQTQVDVLLQGETYDERRVALLVEVKLTEPEFGGCSHAEVAPAAARSVCAQSGPFGEDEGQCFQLRNRDQGEGPRTYNEYLTPTLTELLDVEAGCWFRKRNQPMRLAALASLMKSVDEFDQCQAVLTAPAGHVSIRRRWAETDAMFISTDLGLLEPQAVLHHLPEPTQWYLANRYGLGPPQHPGLQQWEQPLIWVLAAELIARDPAHWWPIETVLSGWLVDCITLVPRNGEGFISISAEGIVYVQPPGGYESRPALEEISRDVEGLADWCEDRLGGERTDTDNREGWPRVMARLAQRFERVATWHAAAPSANGDSNPVHPLFRDMHCVLESVEHRDVSLNHDIAAHQIWFLTIPEEQPIAAIDLVNGTGWNRAGRQFNLQADHQSFFADIASERIG